MAIYGDSENEDEDEIEGKLEELSPLLINVIKALITSQRFEILKNGGSRSIRALDQLTEEFTALMINRKTQTTIVSFFSTN